MYMYMYYYSIILNSLLFLDPFLYRYTDLCAGPIASVSFAYSIKLMTNSSIT